MWASIKGFCMAGGEMTLNEKQGNTDVDLQEKQLHQMSVEHLILRIQHNQRETDVFLRELTTRANLQEYTEGQHNELLTLLREAETLMKGIHEGEMVIAEWITDSDKLMSKIRRKL